MADALDLKSKGPLKGRAGSSPATGTSLKFLLERNLKAAVGQLSIKVSIDLELLQNSWRTQ